LVEIGYGVVKKKISFGIRKLSFKGSHFGLFLLCSSFWHGERKSVNKTKQSSSFIFDCLRKKTTIRVSDQIIWISFF